MPPTSAVPVELAVRVLKKHISHFVNGLPPWNSDVWKLIQKDSELKGRWTLPSVRTNIREDRRNILSEAKRQCGILDPNLTKKSKTLDGNCKVSDVLNDASEDEDSADNTASEMSGSDSVDDNVFEQEPFTVEITRELWNEMKNIEPLVYKGRKYKGFKPKVWTNLVSFAFFKQHHLKCAFVFKRGRITENGRNYATMHGHCRAKNCKNPVRGIIKDCPGDIGPVYIKMFCRDTRFVNHDDIKRPLNGMERSQVQKELTKIGASAWRKKKAKETIDPGDTGSPFLYESNTLHQAKKEACDKELGINPEDKKDMISAVRKMNVDPTYVHSILAIGDTPFYVFYATPTQFQAYDEYQRTHRKYSSICVDATGGVVKKLINSSGDKTGYVFLYEIVINFDGTSVAVYQMLSEKHDVNFIAYWLREWLGPNRKAPGQAVSDGSKALLNAMSLAFNYKPLKEYINYCFEIITTDSDKQPNTFIRLDTAHLIHSVSKWKCFQSALNKIVKTFFIHCMALIIECESLERLEHIFILMLIVADTEFDDSIIAVDNKCLTPSEARHLLENLISDRKSNSQILIPDVSEEDLEKKENSRNFLDQLSKVVVNNLGWSVELLNWVNALEEKACTIIFTGSKLNSFRVQGLRGQLVTKIKEFPIFTNICTPDTMSRATSCYVEGDFKDLKTNLEKQVKLPTTLIKFLKLHIEELVGGVCIFRSKVNKFIVDNQYRDNLNDNDHDKWFENWRGLGKKGAAQNKWTSNNNAEDENVPDNSNSVTDELTKDNNSIEDDAGNVNVSFEEKPQNEDNDVMFAAENVCSNVDVSSIIYDHDYSLKSDSPIHLFTASESTEDYLQEALKKMYKEKSDNKKDTKYFQDYTEIKLQNNLVDEKTKKTFILSNGNSSGIVNFKKQTWIAYNTCPFDTIIQLLFNGALENPNFNNFITQSDSPVFKFLSNFINKGPIKDIYYDRLSILYPLYIKTTNSQDIFDKETKKTVLCQTINCRDNITLLWKKLLENEPSLLEQTVCSNEKCHTYTTFCSVLSVNHKTIIKKGFSALEKALEFHDVIYNIPCHICKVGKQTRQNVLKQYLYIELDIRGSSTEKSGREGKLRDFPVKICLNSQNEDGISINFCYRLSGIAAYDTGHYLGYCRKLSGTWTTFNDLKSKPEFVSPSSKLEPHGAFYVLEKEVII